MLEQKHLDSLVELLAHVYNQVRWKKLRVRSPHNVWNHRVRAAAHRVTLDAAISRLANYFGVQALPERAVELVVALRPYEQALLDVLARDHITYSMLAVMKAKDMAKQKQENHHD